MIKKSLPQLMLMLLFIFSFACKAKLEGDISKKDTETLTPEPIEAPPEDPATSPNKEPEKDQSPPTDKQPDPILPVITAENYIGDNPTAFGEGTDSNPYLLGTVEQFSKFAGDTNLWSKSFRLIKDLDLTGSTIAPIGNSTTPFSGSFDGGEKIIKNFSSTYTDQTDVGLFGVLSSSNLKKPPPSP